MTKKEERNLDERTILNSFYGYEQEEKYKHDMALRDGLISQMAPKGEEELDEQTRKRKYKVEILWFEKLICCT